MHLSSASDQSWSLRLEGIQGPVSLPTWKESRKILESAAKDANVGFSQQGVQGCLHTQHSRSNLSTRARMEWEMEDTACPQGIQGCTGAEEDEYCGYFATWLDNCRRYGLSDCDQQLQGIQSGRLTLTQVLAEQEARINEIADSYRKRAHELPNVEDESLQGAQGDLSSLPDIDSPCPQGVQGDDCVQFKLWLENCHRFGLHECMQQLQGFQSGRVTLAQIFAEQDAMIREVVQRYQQKRI